MKKLCKRLVSLMLAVIMVVIMAIPTTALPVMAFSETKLATNNSWVSGKISNEGDVNYYKITIKKAGWLTVTGMGMGVGYSYWTLQDEDFTQTYWSAKKSGTSESNPGSVQGSVCLEAGTYYFTVSGYDSWYHKFYTGSYRLKASFEALGNIETEPNNEFGTATKIKLDQKVTGAITQQDTNDYYCFELDQTTTIKMTATLTFKLAIDIYDSNRNVLWTKGHDAFSLSSNPAIWTSDLTLDKGVYYIYVSEVGNVRSVMGKYELQVDDKSAQAAVQKISVANIKVPAIKKAAITLKWKKVKGISGYQIRYSLKKSMKSSKNVKVSASKTAYTFKKLKSKKNYYFQIRAYRKNANGSVKYGKWSGIKKVTTK